MPRPLPRMVVALGLSLVVPTSLAGAPGVPASPQGPDTTTYHRWHAGLRQASPDPQRGARLSDLRLERDEAVLDFVSGTIHLLEEIDGRTYGAVFVGDGRITLTPPIAVEQAELLRHFDTTTLAQPFSSAVLFFTDATESDLAARVAWEALAPPSEARKKVEEALEYDIDDKGWISRPLGIPLLNGGFGYFHAYLDVDRGGPIMFEVNPYDFEEVTLFRKAGGKGDRREPVARFDRKSDYTSGSSLPQEALDLVAASRYDIDITLDNNLNLQRG